MKNIEWTTHRKHFQWNTASLANAGQKYWFCSINQEFKLFNFVHYFKWNVGKIRNSWEIHWRFLAGLSEKAMRERQCCPSFWEEAWEQQKRYTWFISGHFEEQGNEMHSKNINKVRIAHLNAFICQNYLWMFSSQVL